MARDFPVGLYQPEGSYRFGEDALLLAAISSGFYKEGKKPRKIGELGCGCGAALLGILLLCPDASGIGLDLAEELIGAARINAQNLGLAPRTRLVRADLADRQWRRDLEANELDMLVANPPWRLPGDGRPAKSDLRESALRSDVLADFCKAAAYLLRRKGFFHLILPANALARAIFCLDAARLGLRLVLPIQSSGKRARGKTNICERIFLRAQKDACADPIICAPYVARPQKNIKALRDGSLASLAWPKRIFAELPDY